MKWWGWGYEDVSFDDSNKPALWPYLKRELQVDKEERTPPVSFEEIQLPEKKTNKGFCDTIKDVLAEGQITDDKKTRLVHATGKS
ncbi:uncharacterized protein METZ01_LOCUS411803, partial [marine metagenome]